MTLTLSPAQHRVASMFAAGLTRDEVARRLAVSTWTVNDHWRKARRRVGVETRREMAALLPSVEIRCAWNSNRHGLTPGQRVRMSGGRYEGFIGEFVRICNSQQAIVRIGLGQFSLRIEYMERI